MVINKLTLVIINTTFNFYQLKIGCFYYCINNTLYLSIRVYKCPHNYQTLQYLKTWNKYISYP